MSKSYTAFIGLLFLVLSALSGCYPRNTEPFIQLSHSNGVFFYDSLKCLNGINVITGYYFVDMHGNKLLQRNADLCLTIDSQRYVGILDSNVFAMFEGDSILWRAPVAAHHEVFVDEDNNIVTLGMEAAHIGKKNNWGMPYIVGINPSNGEIAYRKSFLPLVEQVSKWLPESRDSIIKRNRAFFKKYMPERAFLFDTAYFHINSVQIIPPNEAEKTDTRFKKGNLLISDFMTNFMAIIERQSFEILWLFYQRESDLGQHSARMQPNGNILFFLNNVRDGDKYYSAVRELNPLTGEVVWEYTGTPEKSLYSITQGHVQPLPNGNKLITVNSETIKGDGYVLEIDSNNTPVWKWTPPDYHQMASKREGFYRTERIFDMPKY
ncbi:MAG: hypothetical protein JNK66_05165 [Chitinophagales bacterium]|nr:hypothetical protein [Chitinophagales bacterium]